MEIRCSQCDHLGAAAEVHQTDSGVGLVCEQCGHVNEVAADEKSEDDGQRSIEQRTDGSLEASESEDRVDPTDFDLEGLGGGTTGGDDGLVGSLGEIGTRRIFGDDDEPEPPEFDFDDDFVEASVQGLIPEPGEGARCRKCMSLLDEDAAHCPQCGLSVAQAGQYPDGQAPWEQPPEGKTEEYRKAREIWGAVWSDDESESLEDYVDFVIEQGLVDDGIRTIQQHLVERPDDDNAVEALGRLAESLEVAVEVAQSQVEAKSDEFQDDVKRFRTRILVAALIFWTVLLLLFSWMFFDIF